MIKLEFSSEYDERTNTLSVNHKSGFFSMCSITLRGLIHIYKNRLTDAPANIIWDKTIWGNGSDSNPFYLYFEPCRQNFISVSSSIEHPKDNGICEHTNFQDLSVLIDAFFTPSKEVEKTISSLTNKYNIDYDKTAAILYRGCDKYIELPKMHPYFYYMAFEKLPKGLFDRVLIQTDQKYALDYLKYQIGDSAFDISELPKTNSETAMHNILKEQGMSIYDLGKNYFSAIHIISRCKYIIMDTGNGPKWISLYRRGVNNTLQIYPSVAFLNNIV